MVLSASRRYSTCKLTNADEYREVAKPYKDEAVDETSRAAA